MIELVPNNTLRLVIVMVQPNAQTKELEPATGLTITAKVAASPTATAAIGSMTYSATEMTTRGSYVLEIPGADITSALQASYMNIPVVIQVMETTNLKGYVDAIVRPVRRL